MGTFDSNGYRRQRLDEWVEELQTIYFSVYGTNIDLSADTLDGQFIGALAEAFSNADMSAEAVSKAFNPAEAGGNSLSILMTINGIKRNDETFSTVALDLTGTDSTLIPQGSLVKVDDSGEEFATDNDVTIVGGVASVTATAVKPGPITATAGTINTIVDSISGWDTVTNPNDASLGKNEESDPDARIRRRASVAQASTGNVDSVRGALLGVEDVTSVVVKENKTGVVDGDGLPAHSIASIVEGGDVEDIALAIWQNKSGGCQTFGTTTETIQDSQGTDHDISFSRPVDVDIYIEMTVKALAGFPSGGDDLIKQAIVDYYENDTDTKIEIGEDVVYSSLYLPINSVGNVSVTALTLDTVTPAVGTADITILFNELARFDTSRITVAVT